MLTKAQEKQLNDIVSKAIESIADLVIEIIENKTRGFNKNDPNIPIFISERVVNCFIMNLLQRIYMHNMSYAYESMLRDKMHQEEAIRDKDVSGIGG